MSRTAERERRKIVAYVQRRSQEMESAAKRSGRLRAEDARMLRRRVAGLADEIEQGMHL